MHLLEFYSNIAQLLKRLGMEEVRRRIYLLHILSFIFLDNRRQLLRISDHQQLNASEWKIVMTISAEGHVHSIKNVSTHHRDLVNNQQIKRTDYLLAFLLQATVLIRGLVLCDQLLHIREIRTQRKLKK